MSVEPARVRATSVEPARVRDIRVLLSGEGWPTIRRGVGVAILTVVGVGLVTELVPNPMFVRMVPRSPPDSAFLVLTALLAGAYVTQATWLDDLPGDTGAIAVSSSAIVTYFDPLRPVVGVASVVLFGGAIYYRHRLVARETCTD